MLVIGTKGFAIQITDVLLQLNPEWDLCFYDDITADLPEKIFGHYPVIKNIKDAENYFQTHGSSFILGIGQPHLRERFFISMTSIGGRAMTIISPKATIGTIGVEIGEGTTILSGAVIESFTKIGKGCLINLLSTITHEVTIGDFSEISPGVHLLGKSSVGYRAFLGSGCIVLPSISIGDNTVIGAGSVVTKNIPNNITALGIPARSIKEIHK